MILNPQQRSAVDAEGHSVVVACPGSGKTRVLVERAIRLRRVSPDADIIVVTFTRQAARELQERLNEKLASLARLRVSTFHSLALQQLLSSTDARICGPSEQLALLRRAAAAHMPDSRFRAFQSAADAYTSGHSSALDESDFQLAYDTYLDLLAEHSAIDFGQSILQAADRMESGTLTPFACDFLLVDEVQDIDPTQIRWVTAHTQAGAQLTIVGDDDQSIYGFRHGMGYRGMQQLLRSHGAQLHNLSINYRSHREVLGLSVKLINNNQRRVAKQLYSARGPGGSVDLHSDYWTDLDEAHRLADHLFETNGKWAVIARTNRKLDLVASCLRDRKIDFSRPGRTQFWESEEPSLFLKLLRPNPLNDPLTRSAAITRSGGEGSEAAQTALRQLASAIRRAPTSADPGARINAISSWLCNNLDGVAENRRERVVSLVERCRDYLCGMPGDLQSRVDRALRPRSSKEERIVLLTMHGAKGREFDAVWIVGCQDGTIPNAKCDDLEEERRLFYVAMTRAETNLHLSFAWNQIINRADGSSYLRKLTPSRFLTIDLGLPVPKRHSLKCESESVYI